MSNILACIPARYGSFRLGGKPLLDIYGKSMIQRTYEQVKKCKNINHIIILTDCEIIYDHVKLFGAECIIVKEDCLNGTERICHSLNKLDTQYNYIINVHGDEPFVDSNNIDMCINNFIRKQKQDSCIKCGTFHYIMKKSNDIESPSKGKIVLDSNNNIIYVSRTPIPVNKYGKINPDHTYYSPSGVFIYNRSYLNTYLQKNTPCQLCEDIEWLKVIELGDKINSVLVEESEISIDTDDDYKYILKKYKNLFK